MTKATKTTRAKRPQAATLDDVATLGQSLNGSLQMVAKSARDDAAKAHDAAIRIGNATAEFAETARTNFNLIEAAVAELRDDLEAAEEDVHGEIRALVERLDETDEELEEGFMRVGAKVAAELLNTSMELNDRMNRIHEERVQQGSSLALLDVMEASTARRVLELEQKVADLMTPWYVRAWRTLVARYWRRSF